MLLTLSHVRWYFCSNNILYDVIWRGDQHFKVGSFAVTSSNDSQDQLGGILIVLFQKIVFRKDLRDDLNGKLAPRVFVSKESSTEL